MRYKALDTWRGLACAGMFLYHFEAIRIFVLRPSTSWLFGMSGFALGQFVRISFIALVGLSTYLIWSRRSSFKSFAEKQVRRAMLVGVAAFVVSVVSYIVIPQYWVVLGILHFIALANVLMIGMSSLPKSFNFLLGAAFIVLPIHEFIARNISNMPIEFVLGVAPEGFQSFDYFGLVPWFGYVLLGFSLGGLFMKLPDNVKGWKIMGLDVIGKKALAFYLLHLPLIYLFWVGYNYFL